MIMEIRVLKYFLAVAREGNITKAADMLHITQPTLSRQLMQLEDELGAALFVRGKRKIILTEAGMLLKRRAEEIVSLSERTESEIGNQDNEVSGEIVLACGITEATNTMGEYIQKFKQLYPNVTFHVRNGNSDFIIESIENGLVDIGFVLEPVNLEKLNFLKMNKKEKYGILMKKDSPLSHKDYITCDNLKGIPLINTARIETQTQLKEWVGSDYNQLDFVAVSELTTIASILVSHNIGNAVVVEGSVNYAANQELCFKPFYPELTTTSLAVWKKYQSFNFTISKFIDFISKEIKENR